MKKAFLVMATLLLSLGMEAQVIQQFNIPKKEKTTDLTWIARAGVNFATMTYSDVDRRISYNVVAGIKKSLPSYSDWYWMVEFGFGSRGYKYSSVAGMSGKLLAHNIQVSPAIGYDWALGDGGWSIDPHGGLFLSVDYTGKFTEEYTGSGFTTKYTTKMNDFNGWKRFDMGVQLGVGVWYESIGIDLSWQRGFVKTWEEHASNLLLRLSYVF